jgi:hypothetical protein
MSHRCTAYTLIEVLASIMVLTIGLVSAASMVLYGLHFARLAQGRSIGLATAATAVSDPAPLSTDPTLTLDWPSEDSGYLNGLWVERREDDPTPLDGQPLATSKLKAVTVSVDVYEGAGGRCVASLTRRVIRQKP